MTNAGSGSNNGNKAPTISINVSTASVSAGATVNITAVTSDPENDTVSVAWKSNGGSFSTENGNATVWTAPNTAGTYKITGTATDGKGGVATAEKSITVTSPGNGNGGDGDKLDLGSLYYANGKTFTYRCTVNYVESNPTTYTNTVSFANDTYQGKPVIRMSNALITTEGGIFSSKGYFEVREDSIRNLYEEQEITIDAPEIGPMTSITTTTYDPGLDTLRFIYAGAVITSTTDETTSTTLNGEVTGTEKNTIVEKQEILSVSTESVTVPAGVYNAKKVSCKITTTFNGQTDESMRTDWYDSTVGLVKSVLDDGSNSETTMELIN